MRTVQLYYPFLDQKQVGNKAALRDKDHIQHLKVLRVNSNDYNFILADGYGRKARVKLLQYSKEGALFEIEEITRQTRDYEHGISSFDLYLPVIRPQKLEIILDQVTQLDIFNNIYLYFSDHNRRSTKTISQNKLNRFEKKIISAFQQSKSFFKPNLSLIEDSLIDYLSTEIVNDDPFNNLFLLPITEAASESEVIKSSIDLDSLVTSADSNEYQISLLIGPEGGFSEKEIEFFLHELPNKNKQSIRWGESILTTETAAISFASLLKDRLID